MQNVEQARRARNHAQPQPGRLRQVAQLPVCNRQLRARMRRREYQQFFYDHYEAELPNDDAGREDFWDYANCVAVAIGESGDVAYAIRDQARRLCSWMDDAELETGIEAITKRPKWLSDKEAGRRLGLTDEYRSARQFRTMWAQDATETPAERRKRRNREYMARKRAERRAARPKSISHIKPWESEGISRRTWYRRRGTKSVGDQLAVVEVHATCAKRRGGSAKRLPARTVSAENAPNPTADQSKDAQLELNGIDIDKILAKAARRVSARGKTEFVTGMQRCSLAAQSPSGSILGNCVVAMPKGAPHETWCSRIGAAGFIVVAGRATAIRSFSQSYGWLAISYQYEAERRLPAARAITRPACRHRAAVAPIEAPAADAGLTDRLPEGIRRSTYRTCRGCHSEGATIDDGVAGCRTSRSRQSPAAPREAFSCFKIWARSKNI